MTTTYRLDGGTFARMLRGGAANLRANASIVNDLNVFPIPDGDTGENMTMTIEGGVQALPPEAEDPLEAVSETAARGMLLSARGNSGVILSQLFEGIAQGFSGLREAAPPDVGEAFRAGVRKAYDAVMTPTEGTILTVAREATEYAVSRLNRESTLESFFEDYREEMHRSLERTPELLPVLKEAGVIDSGGAGLVYVIEGMERSLRGEDPDLPAASGAAAPHAVNTAAFNENSVMEFGYCTEFLLQLQTCKVDPETFPVETVTAYLETVGNSIVAFKTGTIIKVHVHTMTPGDVIAHCQMWGEFLTMKIENMAVQHSETTVQNRWQKKTPEKKHRPFAMVTVASGAGVSQMFRELGADVVVEGGQCMNPSAEDFLRAFEEADADVIFVLPNNGNVVLAARQAAELYDKADVRVIESKTIGEGYAALTMLSYDSGNTDEIAQELRDAMTGVVTGLVSRSVRDASIGGLTVHAGEYIGLSGHEMLSADESRVGAAAALLDAIDLAEHAVLIAIRGAGVPPEEGEALRRCVAEKYPMTEWYEIDGGQDVYDFILVAE